MAEVDRRAFVLSASPGRALWSLAWPIAISNELAILTIGVMLFWLGRLIGDSGLAVESLQRPFTLLVAWLFGATSVGASVLVSRSVGADDGRGMSIAASAVTLTAAMWIAVGGIVLVTMPWLVDAVTGDLAVLAVPMQQFLLVWFLVALPGMAIAEVLLDVANATGATKFNLVRVLVELAFMAAIAPLFMDTLGAGIAGAPLAQGVAALGLCLVLWFALVKNRVALKLGEIGAGFRIRWDIWKEILSVGLPMQIARIAFFVSQLILLRRISHEGEAAVAGYGIADAWILFGAMATMALAQAGGILVGQALGAKLYDRARRCVRTTLLGGWLVMALFVGVTLFDRSINELVISDPAVGDAAHRALSILRWAGFGIAAFQILLNAFGAYKATVRASMLLVGSEVVGLAVAFAWPGSYLDGACLAVVASTTLKGVLLVWLLATGHHRRGIENSG